MKMASNRDERLRPRHQMGRESCSEKLCARACFRRGAKIASASRKQGQGLRRLKRPFAATSGEVLPHRGRCSALWQPGQTVAVFQNHRCLGHGFSRSRSSPNDVEQPAWFWCGGLGLIGCRLCRLVLRVQAAVSDGVQFAAAPVSPKGFCTTDIGVRPGEFPGLCLGPASFCRPPGNPSTG